MRTLLAIAAMLYCTAASAAGCWKSPLETIEVGEEEISVNHRLTCDVGSVEGATYNAGCITDGSVINYISVTEHGDTATLTWNEEKPRSLYRCPQ